MTEFGAFNGVKALWQRGGPAKAMAFRLMPLVAAILLIAIHRQQMTGAADWGSFLVQFAAAVLASFPLMVVHGAALKLERQAALASWVIVFGLYPLLEGQFGWNFLLRQQEWLILAVLSGLSLLFEQQDRANMLAWLRHVPVTFDGSIIALLALWVLAASSVFIATPDPVNNQPLSIWFDGARIAGHPWLFASYILQFSIMAALIYGYYWLCRHLLVRRALRERGWVSFFASSLGLWLIYTPLACSIVLLMPLNTIDWALIPSETPNPFHPDNFRFSAALWVLICPIVLASERLLALANAAMSHHEQVRAELQMLQQQINPHFLFNTLNTLYSLCLKDNASSAQAIVKLSDLLRYSVYDARDDWVPLDGEVDHLRNYLDLQLLRFGAHCRVDARWPDGAGQYQVPPQLLIVLVENTFKHGVERSDQPCTVTLHLTIADGRMDFRCTNSPLPDIVPSSVPGLGLANLRRRLELICEDDFRLESMPKSDAWLAQLELGLRRC